MKKGAYRIPVYKGYQQTTLAGSLFIFEKWFVPYRLSCDMGEGNQVFLVKPN